MTALYAPVIPTRRPKRIPRKCSTCMNGRCRLRWRAVDWLHCGEWTQNGVIWPKNEPETTGVERKGL